MSFIRLHLRVMGQNMLQFYDKRQQFKLKSCGS